jgi:hypothetical protein
MGRRALDAEEHQEPGRETEERGVAHSTVAHQVQEKAHGDQGQGYEEPHAVEVGLEVDEPPVDRHEPGPDQTHPPIHQAPAQPPRQEHGRQSPEGLERSNGQWNAAGDGDQGREDVRVPRGPLERGVSNRRIPSGGVGRRRPVTGRQTAGPMEVESGVDGWVAKPRVVADFPQVRPAQQCGQYQDGDEDPDLGPSRTFCGL